MSMGIRAVLFDVDGTLFSSESIITDTYLREFRKFQVSHGKPSRLPDHGAVMDQIGKPIVEIFQNLAPDLTEEERIRLSENILEDLVRTILEGGGEYYPGVVPTHEELHRRGCRIFAASNGRYPYIDAILTAKKIKQFYSDIPVVDNRTIHNKVELVKSILEKNGLDPGETLMVGDRYSDRDAALENGCYFVACRYGHGNEEEWKGAHFYIDEIGQLLDYL